MKTYTHAQMMAEIVKRAQTNTLDFGLDNDGQFIFYTNLFEQMDGTIGDECDPKYADAHDYLEEFCDECGAEIPGGIESIIGDFHSAACSLHSDPAVKAADTFSYKALREAVAEAIGLYDESNDD